MSNLVDIQGEDSWKKDINSGAIINVNKKLVQDELRMVENRKKEKQEIQDLKSEVKDIKELLNKLVEKLQ